ncbi:RacP protein [Streptomyces sp. BG9H]|uniref:RacP protein n=1 Tax=Streptomyces anatolicus TaxID=2675858 RepID=A0ABS6YKV4_9ACTN|nr:RacP protein [Streptomyces anatolicus]MBW5422017.1 RacP protein [Streptomyces anatolicus]
MARSRRKGDAAQRHSECIRRILMEARPAGLDFGQLMATCELTRAQARDGLAMLRDTITKNGWLPLIYSRQDGLYMFTVDPDELERFEVSRIRELLTEAHRLANATIAPHAAHAPDDKRVQYGITQIKAVEATLDLIA